jgi:hypothetical protein
VVARNAAHGIILQMQAQVKRGGHCICQTHNNGAEELRQTKLGDLREYLGLVPVRTPLPGRATPPTDAEV